MESKEPSFGEKSLQKNEQGGEKNPEKKEECDECEELEPEVIKKQLEKNPAIMRETIMGFMKSGPMMPPFLEKIDGKHITQALSTMDKEMEHEYKDRKWKKCFTAFYVIIGLGVFVYLAHFFVDTNNIDLLKEILKIGGAVVVGAFGGYGMNEVKHKNK